MSKSPFMASLQHELRRRGYAIKTEKSYLYWVRRFILFHHKQHPTELSDEDVKTFLSYLANAQQISPNTQKVALNALAFLYNQFLDQPLGKIAFSPSKKSPRIPIVLSKEEVARIFAYLGARDKLIHGKRMNIRVKKGFLTRSPSTLGPSRTSFACVECRL